MIGVNKVYSVFLILKSPKKKAGLQSIIILSILTFFGEENLVLSH